MGKEYPVFTFSSFAALRCVLLRIFSPLRYLPFFHRRFPESPMNCPPGALGLTLTLELAPPPPLPLSFLFFFRAALALSALRRASRDRSDSKDTRCPPYWFNQRWYTLFSNPPDNKKDTQGDQLYHRAAIGIYRIASS